MSSERAKCVMMLEISRRTPGLPTTGSPHVEALLHFFSAEQQLTVDSVKFLGAEVMDLLTVDLYH